MRTGLLRFENHSETDGNMWSVYLTISDIQQTKQSIHL